MSLKEVLDAVRVLTDNEREKVRELIDSLDSVERSDRYKQLRGSLVSDQVAPVSLEDLKTTRREVWGRLAN